MKGLPELNLDVEAKIEESGKPYGGYIQNARFYKVDGPEFEGLTTFEFCTGDLTNDPRNRFGKIVNVDTRTSYIINKTDKYIETRNSIYEYEEKVNVSKKL